jgi:DTW domain-containing protein
MATRTRFVFLMSPKEFKEEKAGTGRLTHLCLPNSELHMGKGFEHDEAVRALLADPANFCVLLYPGRDALNLSGAGGSTDDCRCNPSVGRPACAVAEGQGSSVAKAMDDRAESIEESDSGSALHALRSQLESRRLVVFLLDATWGGARKLLRLSPSLQQLPRIMFTPTTPSRYIIKQQPQEGCLSTLEAVHELLLVLERSGLDRYPDPEQLIALFHRMQDFQMKCAADPTRPGYRRRAYSDPATRKPPQEVRNYLKKPRGPGL